MPNTPKSDKAFIHLLTEIVVRNLSNEDFRIHDLAREAGLSSSTLNRRLHRIAGKSGNQFIREIRLHKAHEMLQEKVVNVSEVSYLAGFSSPAYFSSCFHEHFGYPPSEVPKLSISDFASVNDINEARPRTRKRSLLEFRKIFRTWLLPAMLAATGIIIFIFLKNLRYPSLDNLRSSDGRITVTVMPFVNLTGNITWNCIQLNLISYLSNFDELTVRQKEAVDLLIADKGVPERPSLTPPVANSISRILDSKVYISGVISEAGTKSRVNVQIVNSKTRKVIKAFQVEGESGGNGMFEIIDSVSVIVKNFLVTARMVKETDLDLKPYGLTSSPEAFEYFARANEALGKEDTRSVLSWYLKAVEADSCFIPSIIFLSMNYRELGDYAESKKWFLKAYSMKDQAHLKERYMIDWYHAVLFGTPEEELRFLKQYVGVDDNVPVVYWQMGNAYVKLSQYTNAIPEYERTLKIYKKWGVSPMMISNYTTLIDALIQTQQYKKARREIRTAAKAFPEKSWILLRSRALLACSEGDTITGNRYVEAYRSEMEGRSLPATDIYLSIANLYTRSGNIAKAEKILREAYGQHPDDPEIMNTLAYLLIDQELNTEEGLQLATEGLKIKPDDHYLLHTLGWGLSKTGSYIEAFEILNKSWDLRPCFNLIQLQHIEEVKRQISSLN
jgi:AraC-like DNA-binding protein/tetratricopeptide (TPR) repeat protein